MSQEQLAQYMTMSGFTMHQTTVAKIESGKRPLRIAELYAIADILDVPLLALLANRLADEIAHVRPSPITEIEGELAELMHERADTMAELTGTVEKLAQQYGERTAQIQFRISSILDAAARVHRGEYPEGITPEAADEIAEKWLRATNNMILAHHDRSTSRKSGQEQTHDYYREFEERNAEALNQIFETERRHGSPGYQTHEDKDGSPA